MEIKLEDAINIFINIVTNPLVISFASGAITVIASTFNQMKNSKKKKDFDLIVEIATEESFKFIDLNLSNDEKRKAVIKNIRNFLPKKMQSIPDSVIDKALVLAYHYNVKPRVKKNDNGTAT